jgi:hypothetical protein
MSELTVLKNTGPITLTKIWYEDGVQADAGDVTIAIVGEAGEVVQASTPATKNGTGATTTYTYSLAIQTALNRLHVTWTRTDTTAVVEDSIEIVGGRLFTIAEAQAFEVSDQQTPLSGLSAATIDEHRTRISDLFADYCGVQFVPRYAREQLPGSGTSQLRIPDHRPISVLAASIGGTAQTVADIVAAWRGPFLIHTTSIWSAPTSTDPRNVTVAYEHGFERVPGDIHRAALLMLLREAVRSSIPERALTQTTDLGTWRLAAPGPNTPTGIPVIDEVLNRYRLPRVN